MLPPLVSRWENYFDYLNDAGHHGPEPATVQASPSWALGMNYDEAFEKAKKGDRGIAAETALNVGNLEVGLGYESRFGNVRTVAGTSVIIPDYLSGTPMCMRRRAKKPVATRHVGIYMFLDSSGMTSAQQLVGRSAAVIGLLECLSHMQVSTDLFVVVDGRKRSPDQDHFQVVRIESRPLDLSVSGFALSHPAFFRNIMYSWGGGIGLQWSHTFYDNTRDSYQHGPGYYDKYIAALRPILGCAETDIIIPPVYANDMLITDPVAWIRGHVCDVTGEVCP